MTTTTPAETRMRPAAELLRGRLDGDRAASSATEELDLLAVEQGRISAETARLIGRMDDARLSAAALDRLTERISALLARAEDVRAARARATARRAGDERRWRSYLDLD